MRTVEEIRAELPRVAFAADRYVATRKSEQQYEIELRAAITTNIPIDRLKTICAAEKDGRLVTLPCKVGGTVWDKEANPHRVVSIEWLPKNVTQLHCISPVTNLRHTFSIGKRSIGKTVFMNYESAKSHLEA